MFSEKYPKALAKASLVSRCLVMALFLIVHCSFQSANHSLKQRRTSSVYVKVTVLRSLLSVCSKELGCSADRDSVCSWLASFIRKSTTLSADKHIRNWCQ